MREVLLEAREVDGAPFAELHRQLRDVLADDAIVCGDSAQVSYYGTVHYFPMSRPRQFLYPAGFATLGYGLPAAIVDKVAFPDRQVVCVMGDGGIVFTLSEFATAVECRLGPADRDLQQRRLQGDQRRDARSRDKTDRRRPPRTTDFPALARAFGGHGVRLTRLTGFADAVRDRAIPPKVPTLIEVVG